VICPACGYKDIEAGDHRCGRCGRRLDRPFNSPPASDFPTPPAAISAGNAAASAALAPAPEWKHEVTEKLEEFRHRRARHQGLAAPGEEESEQEGDSDTVPALDLTQKVIPFEDIGADRIEPVIVDLPKRTLEPAPPEPESAPLQLEPAPPALPPLSRPAAQTPRAPSGEVAYPPEERNRFLSSAAYDAAPRPAAPVAIRALAGALDAAVATVAVGVFFGTFHLLGGALHFQQRPAAGLVLAALFIVGFYLFVYTCYVAETPGLLWTGLRVVDYDGQFPRAEQRLLRALGALLSGAALGLGYVWAFVDEEGLTWHDRMSRTYVVRDTGAPQYFRPR
jgi:uncharacterized RDD family membrane protein YckC